MVDRTCWIPGIAFILLSIPNMLLIYAKHGESYVQLDVQSVKYKR